MPHDVLNQQEQSVSDVEQRIRELEQRVEELERERLLTSGELPVSCGYCAESARKVGEAEAQFRSMFLEAFEGLAISVDGKIVLANPALGALGRCKPEELVGRTVLDLTTPQDGVRALQKIRDRDQSPYEIVGVRPDGSTFPCEVMGRTVVYGGKTARLSSFRDLTHQKDAERARRRFEERLQRAQKLEDLGVIAGGVAHDFNNLLLVMHGHAELALTHAGPLVAEHLRKIQSAAQSAGELTAQMLTFAGRGAVEREAVELGKLVREVLALCHGALGGVNVDTSQIAHELPTVFADSSQMRQLVMNLVVNAVEALTDRSAGLAIAVREVERTTDDLHELTVDASKAAGRFVELEVRDDGCGMDADTMGRIFDPFFSTKFQGRGLGLASVLGIVRGHAGALDVESTIGQGTRFTLLFPLAGR